MKNISVRLPDKILEDIDALVENGTYANRTDALRDAARLLLRSQYGILPGKPKEISKDEVWKEYLEDINE
ncbi:MAG: ribbon-helix-helix domain-containing protein [Candidatus Bathyarchaeota archaeon]|nr:ribbon-helix-helix domain-containing protein [Candidatus Bathyarchaeota archaeon]